MDEKGWPYLHTNVGFGLVHTQDVLQAADFIESGLWVPQEMPTRELPNRFGYVRSPQQLNANTPT
jgi:hypothetical protein